MKTKPVEGLADRPAIPRSKGLARYIFVVMLRSRVVALLLGVGSAFIAASFILTYLTPGTEHRTFLDAAYLGVELLAVLAPILGSMILMVQEFDQRTLWLILVRPVTRSAYARGRFWGLAGVCCTVVAVTTALVALLLGAAGALPEPWLVPVAVAALLEVAIVSALACLVTFATTSWVTAALVQVGIVILGYASSLLPILAAKPELSIWKAPLLAVYWLLPHLSRFAVRDFTEPPETWYLMALVGYAAAYTGATLSLAAWTFRHREI